MKQTLKEERCSKCRHAVPLGIFHCNVYLHQYVCNNVDSDMDGQEVSNNMSCEHWEEKDK